MRVASNVDSRCRRRNTDLLQITCIIIRNKINNCYVPYNRGNVKRVFLLKFKRRSLLTSLCKNMNLSIYSFHSRTVQLQRKPRREAHVNMPLLCNHNDGADVANLLSNVQDVKFMLDYQSK